ncbi:MAG TPA: hypothetical protein VKJ07_20150, partial [Mycobacteriales bacterium]|nr:hypothetical protein [Mycobacteriales bacterium]
MMTIVRNTPAMADTAPVDPSLPETVSAAALPTVQINGVVWAQVIVGNRVYATGQFSQARPAGAALGTSETPRSNILAYDLTTGALITSWAPSLNAQGLRLAASADGSTIYVGGDFDQVSGQSRSRIAALDAQTGAVLPFNPGANATVEALALNGNTLYFGGDFTTVGTTATGFSARTRLAAVDATTGALFPWAPAADGLVRTMAIDKHRSPTLTNAFGTSSIWAPFAGMPAAQPLHWLPTLSGGTYTGQYQAAWSVASNGDYTVEGGEFPKVNGIAQQGLVRFAKRTISPLVDPVQNYSELTPTLTPLAPGTVRVGWKAAWDRDNQRLEVEVLRGDTTATSTVLKTFQTDTTWWNRPPLGLVDTTAPPGSTQTYRIRVTDPFGNGFAGPPATVTIPSGSPTPSTYAATVLADNPNSQWRLGETGGTTAYDQSGSNDLTLDGANNRNVAGAL